MRMIAVCLLAVGSCVGQEPSPPVDRAGAATPPHTLVPPEAATAPRERVAADGRVRSLDAAWRNGRIITRVTLESPTGEAVEFDVPGGALDGIAMSVSGMPRFVEGQYARVQLRRTPRGLMAVPRANRIAAP